MKTTANLFNFVDMLRLNNSEINNIAAQDFTLDELTEFAAFLNMLGEHYNVIAVKDQYKNFCWWVNDYNSYTDHMTMDEIEHSELLDDEFLSLKLCVEDMAAELVLYSGKPFFSEARR